MVDSQEIRRDVSTTELKCLHCGAALPSGADKCWLCFSPVVASGDRRDSDQYGARSKQDGPIVDTGGFSLATMMMLVTLIFVVIGVFTIAPGIGIPLSVVLLVVWIRTAAVARHRLERGAAVTRGEKIQLFFQSLGIAIGLIALTFVAGFAALFAACFAICASPGNSGAGGAIIGVFVVPLLFLVLTILVWVRVIRRRWQHDIGKDK
jgi:hypothetical protein